MTTNITEFYKGVQPHVLGCPRFMVENAVIDAIIKFCEDTHCMEKAFEHDVLSTDVNTADNDSVNVNIASYITNVRPLAVTEFKIDGASWDAAYIEFLDVMDDIGEHLIDGAKLFTYPDSTHIKFYDIEIEDQRFYIKQAYAPVRTATTVDDLFYHRYHKAIEAGALAELMVMPKKDWTDPMTAAYFRGIFNDGVASANARKDMAKGSRRPKSMRFF